MNEGFGSGDCRYSSCYMKLYTHCGPGLIEAVGQSSVWQISIAQTNLSFFESLFFSSSPHEALIVSF